MANDDDRTDSIDEAPDRDPGTEATIRDALDEAAFGEDRPNDPSMGTTADEDPMTAIAGDMAYPTPPDD